MQELLKYLSRGCLYVLLYQIMVWLSNDIFLLPATSESSIRLFFLAPALSLVFIMHFGWKYIPFLSINPIYNTIINERPMFMIISLPILLPLVYGTAGYLLKRILRDNLRTYSINQVIKFASIALIAPLVNALAIQLVFLANDRINLSDIPLRTFDWFIGDLVGIFTLAPLLLISLRYIEEKSIKQIFSINTALDHIKPIVILLDNFLIAIIIYILMNYQVNLLYALFFPTIFISIRFTVEYTIFVTTYNSLITAFLLSQFNIIISVVEFEALMVTLIVTAMFLSAAIEDRKITEAKLKIKELNEIENEKFVSIGKLAQGISHDLNNVLTSLNTQIDLLKLKEITQEYELKSISQSLAILNNLATQFRSISSFTEPVRQELSINKKIDDMKMTLANMIGHNVKIIYNQNPIEGKILANKSHIEQIILNLVVNANEAIEDKGKITIETYQNQNRIHINIRDTGRGMDISTKENLFEVLFTTKENHTGLGLWIVNEIIQNNNGQLTFESEVGHGTVFKINFPQI